MLVGRLIHQLGADHTSFVRWEKEKADTYFLDFHQGPLLMQDHDWPHRDSDPTAAFLTCSHITHQDQGALPTKQHPRMGVEFPGLSWVNTELSEWGTWQDS